MKQITISLDEAVADSLASRIDDTMPTLEHVVQRVLTQNAEQWDEDTGFRKPCQCGYLQKMAEDPDCPIRFDARTNEFHFEYRSENGGGYLMIHHCPTCGGSAPKSIRASLFAVVSVDEARRLNSILGEIITLDDALKKLGPPDRDSSEGVGISKPEDDGKPPTMRLYRSLVYGDLSTTVDVHLTDYKRESVDVRFQGKYLGSATGPGSPPAASDKP